MLYFIQQNWKEYFDIILLVGLNLGYSYIDNNRSMRLLQLRIFYQHHTAIRTSLSKYSLSTFGNIVAHQQKHMHI